MAEYIREDAERIFSDPDGPATDEIVDGNPLRAIVKGLETDPAKYEQLYVERFGLWILSGDLTPFPHVGRSLVFRGHKYTVELSNRSHPTDHLILMRFAG